MVPASAFSDNGLGRDRMLPARQDRLSTISRSVSWQLSTRLEEMVVALERFGLFRAALFADDYLDRVDAVIRWAGPPRPSAFAAPKSSTSRSRKSFGRS